MKGRQVTSRIAQDLTCQWSAYRTQIGVRPDVPNQVALQRKVTVLLPFELPTIVELISGEP